MRTAVARTRTLSRTIALIGTALAMTWGWTAPCRAATVEKDLIVKAVAAVGEPAPATAAAASTFADFEEPGVDSEGNVVFEATLSNAVVGEFFRANERNSLVELISATDTAIPGIGTPASYDGPAISANGIVAFVANELTGVAGVTSAVLRKRSGKALDVSVKTGDIAPGTGGALFDAFDDVAINRRGDIAFIATYTADAGVTDKTGLFIVSTKNVVSAVVLNGDVLPDTAGGTQDATSSGDIDGPWLNDRGDVAFAADRINAVAGAPFEGSVFLKRAKKPLQSLLLIGAAVPLPVGGTIGTIYVGRPGLNNSDVLPVGLDVVAGTVTALVGATSPKRGITTCALNGGAVPDTTTATFGPASNPFGNPSIAGDTLVFHAEFADGPSNTNGLFSCVHPNSKRPSLREIVLPSDPKAVGTWGFLEEDSTGTRWVAFDDEDVDGAALGVYIARLPGPEAKVDKD